MIHYTPPEYNLTVDEWIPPNNPSVGAPDRVGLRCQVFIDSRMGGIEQFEGALPTYVPPIIFRHPDSLTRIRGTIHNLNAGGTRYYRMVWSDVFHPGFPNAYHGDIHYQCDADGTSPASY